jgi:UDP-N-acetylmuramate dehydrogenase
MDLTGWEQLDGSVKVSAAGIIDRLGLKGERLRGAQVSTQHSLVIVNQGSATFGDIEGLAKKIQDLVFRKLHIHLDIEPITLPFS